MRQRIQRDHVAGAYLAELREDRGLSRQDLAEKMVRDNPRDPRMHASARTIERIEKDGAIPTARVKFALAAQFDLLPSQVWGSRRVVGDHLRVAA